MRAEQADATGPACLLSRTPADPHRRLRSDRWTGTMRNSLGRAQPDLSGHQVVDIVVDRGYTPCTIVAAEGIPIRLVFHRQDEDPCSERVVFSSPRIDRRLMPSGTTTIELPGQLPGQVRFTCGMGLYRGRIEVLDSHRPSAMGSLRRWLASRRGPAGAAFFLAISLIPAVALLSLVDFSGLWGLTLAAPVLAGWIAACRWAGRHLAHST